MKPGQGKQKGSQFERDICKQLSKWISHGQRDDLLWRSAMSGGRATIALNKGNKNQAQAGDISMVDRRAEKLIDNFIIECKSYKSLHFSSIFKTPRPNRGFIKFWAELTAITDESIKMPMMIMRENYGSTLVVVNTQGYEALFRTIDTHLFTAYFCEIDAFIIDFEVFKAYASYRELPKNQRTIRPPRLKDGK